MAFEKEYFKNHPTPTKTGTRVLHAWSSEDARLPNAPIKEGYAVILGRFSMGYHPRPTDPDKLVNDMKRLAKVQWLTELPDIDQAWQFTVLIGDPDFNLGPPGTRAMRAVPVGGFRLPNNADVWVMRHVVPVNDKMKENIANAVQTMANGLGRPEEPAVYRGHMMGRDGGLRWVVEVAATHGAPAGVLDL